MRMQGMMKEGFYLENLPDDCYDNTVSYSKGDFK
jgi:hypothetical protein